MMKAPIVATFCDYIYSAFNGVEQLLSILIGNRYKL